MKKSFNSTLILLAVFAGLLAWYLLYEKKIKPQHAEQEAKTKILVATPRESIQELVVEQRQGDENSAKYRTLHFKKTGTDWNILSPVEDLADTGAINGLINALTGTKHDRVVDENPVELAPFGLRNPKLKITLKKDSSTPGETLWVGNDTPVGASVYVQIVGKPPVYRAGQALRTSFDKDTADYRDKRVIQLSKADVTEVEIKTPSEAFVLKKASEGDGWILAREGLPAADLEVNKTVNAVLEMNATAFASEKTANLAPYGLGPAGVSLTFKKKDGQALILLGKAKDKFYAKRGDKAVVYEIAKDPFERASRPAKEYRDLKLAHFNRFEVKRIKVEHGKESYELVKNNTDWKVASDDAAKIDATKVEDFLSRLQDVKVTAFGKAADKPKNPELVIHLFEKKGDAETETVTLKLGKAGKLFTGERSGLDVPFSLGESEFKKINAFKQEFLASEKKAENKAENGKS